MAMMQSITFGGVNSADYGIYIGGEGVFNAPKREVEMIEIPGRNGAFALDKGRFENITVEYTAINHEPDLSTFSANLDAFRNALSAQKGYQRLTDTFHPDEYRMATLRDGLEIEPIEYNTASKFKIKFDCKPQRFLMGGEAPITVENGGTILNPTLFDASPLLEVKGNGNVNIDDYTISLSDEPIGYIVLMDAKSNSGTTASVGVEGSFKTAYLSNGDVISVEPTTVKLRYRNNSWSISNLASSEADSGTGTTETEYFGNGVFDAETVITGVQLTAGQTESIYHTTTITVTLSNSSTVTVRYRVYFSYNADTGSLRIWAQSNLTQYTAAKIELNTKGITAMSTASPLGNPTYIDCDLGEAYKIEDGEFLSLNKYIDLGSDLPILAVGSSEITFDNTITEVKVTPRWWKV